MAISIKSREILEGLLAATREFEHGLRQVLAGEVLADQETLGHLVTALREMHGAAATLLHADEYAIPPVMMHRRHLQVLETLGRVAFKQGLDKTIAYILQGFVDGVRRPGAWERECVRMFFDAEAVIEAHRSITGS